MTADMPRTPQPAEEKPKDVRFCPYCFLQQFDVTERDDKSVYCEVCGVDVETRMLEKL